MSVKISVHVVGLARPDSPRESSCARFIGADDTVDEFNLFYATFYYFMLKHQFHHLTSMLLTKVREEYLPI